MRCFLLWLVLCKVGAGSVREVYKSEAEVHVGLILQENCTSRELSGHQEALINSAIWAVHQLELQNLPSFGVSIYTTCSPKDHYRAVFDLFQNERQFLLGLITDAGFTPQLRRFVQALDLQVFQTAPCPDHLIQASVSLLSALNWVKNITVVAPNHFILDQFAKRSKNRWICVRNLLVYESRIPVFNSSLDTFVVFGDYQTLSGLLQTTELSNSVLIPLDGSQLHDLPDNSYVVSLDQDKQQNYTPNPQTFEVANPLAAYGQNLKKFIQTTCNETANKVSCLKTKYRKDTCTVLGAKDVADLLRINKSTINYHVYKMENSSLRKIFTYNIFNDNLIPVDLVVLDNATRGCDFSTKCRMLCKNFAENRFGEAMTNAIRLRQESWVFAFLSLSLLGVLFSVAILMFLLISMCRSNIFHLEGNPLLTILLLVVVMSMFCSIIPLTLDSDEEFKQSVCVARVLCFTLSFAGAFSLILSRTILLATASKELGFMSHVAGPVQSFLCLFIFGVQAALSLQVVNKCSDFFDGYSFLYLMSYNATLLLLLLCFCPMIFKSERNYNEGKYFTWATVLVCLLWSGWIPAYVFVEAQYKDFVLCFALVSTASAFLGTIFVPRTYLMTIAAAREKLTSTLPGAHSAMDIYRTGAQPVYDCINVAAINAVAVARAGLTPDLYSCPNLPDDEFDVCCATPIDDKVTRF